MATIGACACFAAISGSSVATAATMGTVALPEMNKYKYGHSLATGTVAAGGTLGILIPPSATFVLYAILTEQSVGKLFIAGIFPGIVLALLFMLTIYLQVRVKPGMAPRGEQVVLKEKLFALKGVWSMLVLFLVVMTTAALGEDWLQFKYDCRHSGNVPDRSLTTPLGLVGAVALTDAVFTAPVVADGKIYVVDGSGAAFCIDAETLRVLWKRQTRGGKANCNNVSSPAIAGDYLHFGTMAGSYYVLDKVSGAVVKEIAFSLPA